MPSKAMFDVDVQPINRNNERPWRPPGVVPGPPTRKIDCGDGMWVLWTLKEPRGGRRVLVQKVMFKHGKRRLKAKREQATQSPPPTKP